MREGELLIPVTDSGMLIHYSIQEPSFQGHTIRLAGRADDPLKQFIYYDIDLTEVLYNRDGNL